MMISIVGHTSSEHAHTQILKHNAVEDNHICSIYYNSILYNLSDFELMFAHSSEEIHIRHFRLLFD